MQKTVTYFEKPCHDNTAEFLNIVKDAIHSFNYKHVIISTTAWNTGVLFAENSKDLNFRLPEGKENVIVAGTGSGADTVTVVRSAASKRFPDLRCWNFLPGRGLESPVLEAIHGLQGC